MQAVINEQDWALAFPVTQKEVDDEDLDINDRSQFVWRDWFAGLNVRFHEIGSADNLEWNVGYRFDL